MHGIVIDARSGENGADGENGTNGVHGMDNYDWARGRHWFTFKGSQYSNYGTETKDKKVISLTTSFANLSFRVLEYRFASNGSTGKVVTRTGTSRLLTVETECATSGLVSFCTAYRNKVMFQAVVEGTVQRSKHNVKVRYSYFLE